MTNRETQIREILARFSFARVRRAIGERKYHPYKIWLSEIRRQRHPEQKKPPRFVKAGTAAAIEADPRQGRLL